MKKFYISYVYNNDSNGISNGDGYQIVRYLPDIEDFILDVQKERCTDQPIIILACFEVFNKEEEDE